MSETTPTPSTGLFVEGPPPGDPRPTVDNYNPAGRLYTPGHIFVSDPGSVAHRNLGEDEGVIRASCIRAPYWNSTCVQHRVPGVKPGLTTEQVQALRVQTVAALHGLLRQLERVGCPHHPATEETTPRVTDTLLDELTPEELAVILAALFAQQEAAAAAKAAKPAES